MVLSPIILKGLIHVNLLEEYYKNIKTPEQIAEAFATYRSDTVKYVNLYFDQAIHCIQRSSSYAINIPKDVYGELQITEVVNLAQTYLSIKLDMCNVRDTVYIRTSQCNSLYHPNYILIELSLFPFEHKKGCRRFKIESK